MSKANFYALFIGINDYQHGDISDLGGCVRDAESVAGWLSQKINPEKYTLKINKLYSYAGTKTALPTRANILAALGAVANLITAGDEFFLFYAGHGSTERAHPSIQSPTGLLSTLVPCDSGVEVGGRPIFDILSIELRALLYNIWKTHRPRIVFVQDSCHSERATRSYGEKLAGVARMVERHPNFGKVREAADFDVFGEEVRARLSSAGRAAAPMSFQELSPMAEHIHLAACAFDQYAYETEDASGQRGGVFTKTLMELLDLTQGRISFHELEARLRLSVNGSFRQIPNLYVYSSDTAARYQDVLGQNLGKSAGVYSLIGREEGGKLALLADVGALQGLPLLKKDQKLAVKVRNATGEANWNGDIEYVGASFSEVVLAGGAALPDMRANLYFVEVSEAYFVQKNAELKVFLADESGEKPEDAICAFFAETFPDTFKVGGAEARYLLSFRAGSQTLSLYKNSEFLAEFGTVAARIDEEAGWPARKTANSGWVYLDEDGGEQKMPSDWHFLAINGAEMGENLAAASFAIETYLSNLQEKMPFEIGSRKSQGFGAYVGDAGLAFLDKIVVWADKTQSEFELRDYKNGFGIFNRQGAPVCEATPSRTLADALAIGEYLRRIGLYKQRILVENPHPERLNAFDGLNFKLQLKGLGQAGGGYAINLAPQQQRLAAISVQAMSDNVDYQLFFNYSSGSALSSDGLPPVYVAALALDIDFSIRAVAYATPFNLGEAPLVHRDAFQFPSGYLKQSGGAVAYLKILVAFKPFDISALLQAGVPLPNFMGADTHRLNPKYGDRACDWLAFTLPIIFKTS